MIRRVAGTGGRDRARRFPRGKKKAPVAAGARDPVRDEPGNRTGPGAKRPRLGFRASPGLLASRRLRSSWARQNAASLPPANNRTRGDEGGFPRLGGGYSRLTQLWQLSHNSINSVYHLPPPKHHARPLHPHLHHIPIPKLPRQNPARQRVLQPLLDHPLQRPRPVRRVVPLRRQQLLHLA